MLFDYWIITLLIISLPIYFRLSARWQNVFLIAASYIFYGYWEQRFLVLMILSTLVNYYLSLKLHSSESLTGRKLTLLMSLIYNLGLLGYFKYYNFFTASFLAAFQSVGFAISVPVVHLILPLGISYYTFKVIGYLIDIYRGDQKPTDILSFGLFVGYFPEVAAGPIGRAHSFLPQIYRKRHFTKEQIAAGLQLILLGYVKKVAIAEAVSAQVNPLFANPENFKTLDLLCGMYLFALQIYGDFSGYTDIVRGISKLLGIDIINNFRQPYLSRNIGEFWKRWHVSLSTWLRDYLYIPLGGNRKGASRTAWNLMATMLLCGLWHGASWAFVGWGGLHGIYLLVSRYIGDTRGGSNRNDQEGQSIARRILSVAVTFHLVSFAWIFFRDGELTVASRYVTSLLDIARLGYTSRSLILLTIFYMSFVLLMDLLTRRGNEEVLAVAGSPWIVRSAAYVCLILIVSFLGAPSVQPFIYFRF